MIVDAASVWCGDDIRVLLRVLETEGDRKGEDLENMIQRLRTERQYKSLEVMTF